MVHSQINDRFILEQQRRGLFSDSHIKQQDSTMDGLLLGRCVGGRKVQYSRISQTFQFLLIIVILFMKTRYDRELDRIQNGLKDKFQMKYKPRNRQSLPQNKEKSPVRMAASDSKEIHHDLHNATTSPRRQQQNSSHLDQLDTTLQQLNFSHHHQDSCLCNDCSCGRHLCKLNVIRPDLRKATVYQTLFNLKKSQNVVVVKAEESSPLRGDHLDLSSIYLKDFHQTSPDKLERPRPQDELKFDGPAPSLTTYGSLFPGHRGENQYVKPTNKHAIGEFPLLAKSVYATEYVPRRAAKSDYQKQHDSLKTGANWFGATTYNKSFHLPNPENYPAKAVSVEKYYKKPDFAHQFETSYKNEFVEKPSAVCPSKIQLQMGSSNGFQRSKHLFRENSDYKSMSPQFKAISTSKHCYV